MRIKLVGFKVRPGKNGVDMYVDIHYLTQNQLKSTGNGVAGGFEVGSDNCRYDPSVPLQVNSEYELLGSVREFKGEKYWRCEGLKLLKN